MDETMELGGSTEGWFTCTKCSSKALIEDNKELLCYEHGKERLFRSSPGEELKAS